jgi:hypothetical protein
VNSNQKPTVIDSIMGKKQIIRMIASILIAIAILPIGVTIVLSIISIVPWLITISIIGMVAIAIYSKWDDEDVL